VDDDEVMVTLSKVDVVTPGGLRYLRERVLTEAVPL